MPFVVSSEHLTDTDTIRTKIQFMSDNNNSQLTPDDESKLIEFDSLHKPRPLEGVHCDQDKGSALDNELYCYIPFSAKTIIKYILGLNYTCASSEGDYLVFAHKDNKIFQRKSRSIGLIDRAVTSKTMNKIGVLVMNRSKTKVLLQSKYGKYKFITDESLHQAISTIGLTQWSIDSTEFCGGWSIIQSNFQQSILHVGQKNKTPILSDDSRLGMIESDTLSLLRYHNKYRSIDQPG